LPDAIDRKTKMNTMPRLPEAIQWHEGMLLAPQHFQQMAVRQEALLHYHLQTVSAYHWGVKHLQIDPVRLLEGTLRVLAIEAVMPDGMVICRQEDDERPLQIDLTAHADQLAQTPVTVHLAVPRRKLGEAQVTGALARFESIEGRPVVDENSGATEVTIPRLIPRISLLLDDNPPSKFVSLPLARVGYRNETYALTDYLPPLLQVPVQSELGSLCTGISRRLREKAVFLADQISSPGAALRGSQTLESKLLIHAMVAALPAFEAVLNTGTAHPYAIYLMLCHIVGDLASLGAGRVPPVLSPYRHQDPRFSFEEAKAFAFRMIDEGIVETHSAIAFDYARGCFTLKLKTPWATPTLMIGVRGRIGTLEEGLDHWMAESLIASDTRIESLKEKRILGATRERVDGDDELVPARGMLLYAVASDSEFIEAERNLVVYNPSDPENRQGPAEVILYVKNR
jgi:type VI secretion system protein ImpJ